MKSIRSKLDNHKGIEVNKIERGDGFGCSYLKIESAFSMYAHSLPGGIK